MHKNNEICAVFGVKSVNGFFAFNYLSLNLLKMLPALQMCHPAISTLSSIPRR